MTGFYKGCYLCAFEKEKVSPEKCFNCSRPEIIKRTWIHSFGLCFQKFQKEYKTSKWSQAIGLAKRNCLPLISSFGRILTFYICGYLYDLKPCLITSVPAYSSNSGLFQGFSSFTTKLLLDSVAEHIKDPQWVVLDGLLVQTREKPIKQRRCKSDKQRKKNIQYIYTVTRPSLVRNRNIILIDDVVTSGATLNECAAALYQAGAKTVKALTLARTSRKREITPEKIRNSQTKRGGGRMIKLTGSVSRKVPIPGTEFSSQSFLAGMEIEVGNEASFGEIQKKFQEMYSVLEAAVKEQIVSNGVHMPQTNGNNSGNGEPITPNQKKLIEKLVREQEIFGKERIRLLNIKTKEEAKEEIKKLLSIGFQKTKGF